MSRSSLLADVMAAVKNAGMVKKDTVVVPHSNFVMEVFKLIKSENYIEDCRKIDNENSKSSLEIKLRYINNKSAIKGMELVSKPSRRIYISKGDVPYVYRGFGSAIISTSKGLFTDKQAREAGVGGEYVLKIW